MHSHASLGSKRVADQELTAAACPPPSPRLNPLQSQIGIKGLSPGPQTERFLALRRAQLRLLSAALVSLLSLAAAAVDAACEALLGAPLASLQLLLLASTVAAGGRQVRTAVGGSVERESEGKAGGC